MKITASEMASTTTRHKARWDAGRAGWVVTWLPNKVLGAAQAKAAVELAECAGTRGRKSGRLAVLAAQLGMTTADALDAVTGRTAW